MKLAAAASLADIGKFPRWFTTFGEEVVGKIVALGCVVTGAALAIYTGLVLTGTNRPLWGDSAGAERVYYAIPFDEQGASEDTSQSCVMIRESCVVIRRVDYLLSYRHPKRRVLARLDGPGILLPSPSPCTCKARR